MEHNARYIINGRLAMVKKSISEKEKELIEKIEQSKNALLKLQTKQKIEIGNMAYKYNLQNIDLKTLEGEFKEIAKKHNISK